MSQEQDLEKATTTIKDCIIIAKLTYHNAKEQSNFVDIAIMVKDKQDLVDKLEPAIKAYDLFIKSTDNLRDAHNALIGLTAITNTDDNGIKLLLSVSQEETNLLSQKISFIKREKEIAESLLILLKQ